MEMEMPVAMPMEMEVEMEMQLHPSDTIRSDPKLGNADGADHFRIE